MTLPRAMPLLALSLVAAVGTPAFAENNFYIGAAVGQSRFDGNAGDFDDAVIDAFGDNGLFIVDGNSSLDKTDTAFGGLIGYQILPTLAIEASYVDLGKLSYTSSGTVSDGRFLYPATADFTVEAKGPTLSAVGRFPLGAQWDLYVRGGAFFAKTKLRAGSSIGGFDGADESSGDSVDSLAGGGVALHLGERFALRTEYVRYFKVGDEDKTGEGDIDQFTVGFIYTL